MKITIPNDKTIEIHNILLDYNGTIATSGNIITSISKLIDQLAVDHTIYVLTGDTFGTAKEKLKQYPVKLIITKSAEDKLNFLNSVGCENSIAIGNGTIDHKMLGAAEISIAVLGEEGLSKKALDNSDILVRSIDDGLKLILEPKRMIATLRA